MTERANLVSRIVHALFRRYEGWTFAGLLALIVGALSVLPGGAAPPGTGDIVRATLPNGLRVVIVRNTLAPVVATSVNYLVGSDETPAGFPGTAHAQEHMMFRGSPGLSADQLAAIGSLMGGQFNANTRESVTQYLFTVPAQDLDQALHIEAVRMQGVADTEDSWQHERGAIEQEVAQDVSSPFYVLYEKLRAALFAGSMYEHDALGTRPSFDKTTAAMLQKFHDAWYAPNNAILVVVGDLDPAATLSKVKALFGSIPSKHLPARPKLALKALKATSLTLPTDLPNTTDILAFRMPGLDSPDYPALEVLADVLNSHRFALYDLVPQGKAISTEFALVPLPKAGLAYAAVSIPSDANPADTAAKIRAILADTIKSGVSADLVAAAKLQEIRDTEFQKNSIEGLASAWADAIALEGLPSPDADLARIEKVTVADVNRVAHKYLHFDQTIDATMVPQKSGHPVAGAGFGGQESFALPSEKPAQLPDWAQPLLAKVMVPPSTLSPVVSTLPNGLTLIVQPETVSDTVTVFGHVRNLPELEEPAGKEGTAIMLDQLLSYGTEHLDRLAFQGALDAIGAEEDAGTVFYTRALAPHFERATELLADNELHPALPADGLENVRARIVPYIGSRNTTPQFLAQQALRHALYPETDPSLRKATPETIRGITLDDVKNYFHATFRPDLTTIVVIGKVDPEQAKAVIAKYFGGWTATGPAPATDLAPSQPNVAGSISVPDASRVQDTVNLAQTLALPRSDPDYYALSLGNAILSGGFYSSRFSIDLRKNAGLVYSVSGSLTPGRLRSAYLVDYACDPENVSKAADIAARDIHTLQTTPAPNEELDRAKALLLQQIVLSEGSIDDIARLYLSETSLGLPVDETTREAKAYVALTPEQVQGAFAKWMRPAALARVSRGPTAQ